MTAAMARSTRSYDMQVVWMRLISKLGKRRIGNVAGGVGEGEGIEDM